MFMISDTETSSHCSKGPVPPLAPVALVPIKPPLPNVDIVSVEVVVVAPVLAGSPHLLIGLVVTPLEPGRCSSSSGSAYALAPPGRARLLGLALVPRHRYPDQA